MVKIPEKIGRAHIRTSYKKGDVFLWEQFPGKEKTKDAHFVFLTDCCEDDSFLSVRATKRVELYNGPMAKRFANETVLIKAGETKIFRLDTILDLTWRRRFAVNDLAKILGAGFKKEGNLSSEIIGRIDESVRKSRTLTMREINLILYGKSMPPPPTPVA